MNTPHPFDIPRRRRYPLRPLASVAEPEPELRMPVDYHLSPGGSMIVVYDLSDAH